MSNTFPPLKLSFYKGMTGNHGALQFRMIRPYFYIKDNNRFKNFNGRFIDSKWQSDPDWNSSWTVKDLMSKEGCIFLEAASTVGKNTYDWDNKIIFSMSITDMGKILMVLEGMEQSVNLFHDPGANSNSKGQVSKILELSSPNGIKSGVFVSLTEKQGNNKKTHKVPLSGDEARTLAVCVRKAISDSIGW